MRKNLLGGLTGVLILSACHSTTPVALTTPELLGEWKGSWYVGTSSGPVMITFRGKDAQYVLEDGKKTYRWLSSVEVKNGGNTVVADATTFSRVDTLKPGKAKDGTLYLSGPFTYKGNSPHGTIRVRKEP